MADESTLPEQKTEMPTERRMGELRKEGHIFHSTELAQVLSMIVAFLMLGHVWRALFHDMQYVLIKAFEMISSTEPLTVRDLHLGFMRLIVMLAPKVFLLVICTATVFALTVFLQTNWNVKAKWIKFNWRFINPMAGIKRIYSLQGLVNTGKSIAKLCLILPLGYFALKALAPRMVMLVHTSIPEVMNVTGIGISSIFWKMMYVLIPLAIFDKVWGKYQWLKVNKMTKDEVKDERKAVEGDESTRRMIINKARQRLQIRLSTAVPKAAVVITNPTHYAVALQYERGRHTAPIVVAKGTDYIAERIREIAKEHKIPIVERKPLARALFASAEVGREIPRELFKAVAEVLAYVFKLKNPARHAAAQSASRQ